MSTAKRPHSKRKKIPENSLSIPPRQMLRILEHDCAGPFRDGNVDGLFDLYLQNKLNDGDSSRFERYIARKGTSDEKKRLKQE